MMKRLQKLLAVVLALCMVTGTLPVSVLAQEQTVTPGQTQTPGGPGGGDGPSSVSTNEAYVYNYIYDIKTGPSDWGENTLFSPKEGSAITIPDGAVITVSGTVTLAKDGESPAPITFEVGSGNVTIQGSGGATIALSEGSGFQVKGGTLTLRGVTVTSAAPEAAAMSLDEGNAIHVTGGGLVLDGAAVTGVASTGDAVYIGSGATLTLKGNTVVTDNTNGSLALDRNSTLQVENFTGQVGIDVSALSESHTKVAGYGGSINALLSLLMKGNITAEKGEAGFLFVCDGETDRTVKDGKIRKGTIGSHSAPAPGLYWSPEDDLDGLQVVKGSGIPAEERDIRLGAAVKLNADGTKFYFPQATLDEAAGGWKSLTVSVSGTGAYLDYSAVATDGRVITDQNADHTFVMWIWSEGKSVAQIQSILHAITFTRTGEATVTAAASDGGNTLPENTSISVTEGTGAYKGHYYMYVPYGSVTRRESWIRAYNDAKGFFFMGMQGYLATVKDTTEVGILYNVSHEAAWVGGTALLKKDGTQISDDDFIQEDGSELKGNPTSESNAINLLYWVCGPETGSKIGGSLGSGFWSTSEPNGIPFTNNRASWVDTSLGDLNNNESCVIANYTGQPKMNDIIVGNVGGSLESSGAYGYFVEFGGYGPGEDPGTLWSTAETVRANGSVTVNAGSVRDDTGDLYVNAGAAVSGNGSREKPYKTLVEAVEALTWHVNTAVIHLLSDVTLEAGITVPDGETAAIRTDAGDPYSITGGSFILFTVPAGTGLTLENVTVSGGTTAIALTGGALALKGKVTVDGGEANVSLGASAAVDGVAADSRIGITWTGTAPSAASPVMFATVANAADGADYSTIFFSDDPAYMVGWYDGATYKVGGKTVTAPESISENGLWLVAAQKVTLKGENFTIDESADGGYVVSGSSVSFLPGQETSVQLSAAEGRKFNKEKVEKALEGVEGVEAEVSEDGKTLTLKFAARYAGAEIDLSGCSVQPRPGSKPEDAPANALYVSADGDDTEGTGSFDEPFATLKKAVETAGSRADAEATIYILSDLVMTSSEDFVTIPAGKKVTILGYTETGKVTIKLGNDIKENDSSSMFRADGNGTEFTLKDIDIDGNGHMLQNTAGNNIFVVQIRPNTNDTNSKLHVANVTFRNIKTTSSKENGTVRGTYSAIIYVQGDGAELTVDKDVVIENCYCVIQPEDQSAGVLMLDGVTAEINCTIRNSTFGLAAIYAQNPRYDQTATVTIGATVTGVTTNHPSYTHGAIRLWGTQSVTFTKDANISGNTGGNVYLHDGTVVSFAAAGSKKTISFTSSNTTSDVVKIGSWVEGVSDNYNLLSDSAAYSVVFNDGTDTYFLEGARRQDCTVSGVSAAGVYLVKNSVIQLTDYYVSAAGDDLNPGTRERPVASLNRAMETAAGEVRVHLLSDITQTTALTVSKSVTVTFDSVGAPDGRWTVTRGSGYTTPMITVNGSAQLSLTFTGVDFAGSDSASNTTASMLYINNSKATVILENSTVSGFVNKSTGAGAVYVSNGTLNIADAVFTDNSTAGSGGALYVITGATVSIQSTQFTDNAAQYGGAIYMQEGTVALTDTTISENITIATTSGAVYGGKTALKLTVSGSTLISGNLSGKNLYLASGVVFNVSDMGAGYVGLTSAATSAVRVGANVTEDDLGGFCADGENVALVWCDGTGDWRVIDGLPAERVAFSHTHSAQSLWLVPTSSLSDPHIYVDGTLGSDSNDGSRDNPVKTLTGALRKVTTLRYIIVLLDDTTYNGEYNAILASGRTVTICSDLPEEIHTIQMSPASTAVNSQFHLPDGKGHVLTLENVTIDGGNNTQQSWGAFFIGSGCKLFIKEGTTLKNFGARPINIRSGGTVEMSGGLITGNTAGSNASYGGYTGTANAGAAVYICPGGTFTMTGGAITGNYSEKGGAVYAENGGTFRVSGNAVISGNFTAPGSRVGADVYLGNYRGTLATVKVIGELGPQARIGVYTQTVPTDSNPVLVIAEGEGYELPADAYTHFFSNKPTDAGVRMSRETDTGIALNRVVLATDAKAGAFTVDGTAYDTLADALEAIEAAGGRGTIEITNPKSIPEGTSGTLPAGVTLVDPDGTSFSGNNIEVTVDQTGKVTLTEGTAHVVPAEGGKAALGVAGADGVTHDVAVDGAADITAGAAGAVKPSGKTAHVTVDGVTYTGGESYPLEDPWSSATEASVPAGESLTVGGKVLENTGTEDVIVTHEPDGDGKTTVQIPKDGQVSYNGTTYTGPTTLEIDSDGTVTELLPDFYVSAAGDDTNPGTREKPYKTLKAALDAANATTKGANIHLLTDVELTASVTLSSSKSFVILGEGGNRTVTVSTSITKDLLKLSKAMHLTLDNVTLDGGKQSYKLESVIDAASNGAVFTMKNASAIKDFVLPTAASSGMQVPCIIDVSEGNGAGAARDGQIVLEAGTFVTGNTANRIISVGSGSKATISATLTGNNAGGSSGFVVLVGVADGTDVTLDGAVIRNNTATGGAVRTGTVLTVTGKTVVESNTVSGTEKNIVINGTYYITAGELAAGAHIGVTVPTLRDGARFGTGDKAMAKYFYSDASGYYATAGTSANTLVLMSAVYTVTDDEGNVTGYKTWSELEGEDLTGKTVTLVGKPSTADEIDLSKVGALEDARTGDLYAGGSVTVGTDGGITVGEGKTTFTPGSASAGATVKTGAAGENSHTVTSPDGSAVEITVSADGGTTKATAKNTAGVTVDGVTFTGAADQTYDLDDPFGDTGNVTASVPDGKSVKVPGGEGGKEITVSNPAGSGNDSIEVTAPAADGAGASVSVPAGGQVSLTVGDQKSDYTAESGAKLTVDKDGKVDLASGSVTVAQGGTLNPFGVELEATKGSVTAQRESDPDQVRVTVPSGSSVTVEGQTYTGATTVIIGADGSVREQLPDYYVDVNAPAGGDGSKEKPYNTFDAAWSAANRAAKGAVIRLLTDAQVTTATLTVNKGKNITIIGEDRTTGDEVQRTLTFTRTPSNDYGFVRLNAVLTLNNVILDGNGITAITLHGGFSFYTDGGLVMNNGAVIQNFTTDGRYYNGLSDMGGYFFYRMSDTDQATMKFHMNEGSEIRNCTGNSSTLLYLDFVTDIVIRGAKFSNLGNSVLSAGRAVVENTTFSGNKGNDLFAWDAGTLNIRGQINAEKAYIGRNSEYGNYDYYFNVDGLDVDQGEHPIPVTPASTITCQKFAVNAASRDIVNAFTLKSEDYSLVYCDGAADYLYDADSGRFIRVLLPLKSGIRGAGDREKAGHDEHEANTVWIVRNDLYKIAEVYVGGTVSDPGAPKGSAENPFGSLEELLKDETYMKSVDSRGLSVVMGADLTATADQIESLMDKTNLSFTSDNLEEKHTLTVSEGADGTGVNVGKSATGKNRSLSFDNVGIEPADDFTGDLFTVEEGGKLAMTDTTMTGKENARGVYVQGGDLTLNSTEISGFNAGTDDKSGLGSGVYMAGGTVTLSGDVKIDENGDDSKSNVYLAGENTLTLNGLGDEASVGVTTEEFGALGSRKVATGAQPGDDGKIKSDMGNHAPLYQNGAIVFGVGGEKKSYYVRQDGGVFTATEGRVVAAGTADDPIGPDQIDKVSGNELVEFLIMGDITLPKSTNVGGSDDNRYGMRIVSTQFRIVSVYQDKNGEWVQVTDPTDTAHMHTITRGSDIPAGAPMFWNVGIGGLELAYVKIAGSGGPVVRASNDGTGADNHTNKGTMLLTGVVIEGGNFSGGTTSYGTAGTVIDFESDGGALTLTDTTITGCTVGTNGAVYVGKYSGAANAPVILVDGKTTVTGNTAVTGSGRENRNISLGAGITVTVAGSYSGKVGVTPNPGELGTAVAKMADGNEAKSYARYFSSDVKNLIVKAHETLTDTLVLGTGVYQVGDEFFNTWEEASKALSDPNLTDKTVHLVGSPSETQSPKLNIGKDNITLVDDATGDRYTGGRVEIDEEGKITVTGPGTTTYAPGTEGTGSHEATVRGQGDKEHTVTTPDGSDVDITVDATGKATASPSGGKSAETVIDGTTFTGANSYDLDHPMEDGVTATLPQGKSVEIDGSDGSSFTVENKGDGQIQATQGGRNGTVGSVTLDGGEEANVKVGEDATGTDFTAGSEGAKLELKLSAEGEDYVELTEGSVSMPAGGKVTVNGKEVENQGAGDVNVAKDQPVPGKATVTVPAGSKADIGGTTYEGPVSVTLDADGTPSIAEGTVTLPPVTGGKTSDTNIQFPDGNTVEVSNPDETAGNDVTVTAPGSGDHGTAEVKPGGQVDIDRHTYTVPEDQTGNTVLEFYSDGSVTLTEGGLELGDGDTVGFGDVTLGNKKTVPETSVTDSLKVEADGDQAKVTVPQGETFTVTDPDGNEHTYKNNGVGDVTFTVDKNGNVSVDSDDDLPGRGVELGPDTPITVGGGTVTAGDEGATLKPTADTVTGDGVNKDVPTLSEGSVKLPEGADTSVNVETGDGQTGTFSGRGTEITAGDTESGTPPTAKGGPGGGTVTDGDKTFGLHEGAEMTLGQEPNELLNGSVDVPQDGQIEVNGQTVENTSESDKDITVTKDMPSRGETTVEIPAGADATVGGVEYHGEAEIVVGKDGGVQLTEGQVTLNSDPTGDGGQVNVQLPDGGEVNVQNVQKHENVPGETDITVTVPADTDDSKGQVEMPKAGNQVQFTTDSGTQTFESSKDDTVLNFDGEGNVTVEKGGVKLADGQKAGFGNVKLGNDTAAGTPAGQGVTVEVQAGTSSPRKADVTVPAGETLVVTDSEGKEHRYTNSGTDPLELEVDEDGNVTLKSGTVEMPDEGTQIQVHNPDGGDDTLTAGENGAELTLPESAGGTGPATLSEGSVKLPQTKDGETGDGCVKVGDTTFTGRDVEVFADTDPSTPGSKPGVKATDPDNDGHVNVKGADGGSGSDYLVPGDSTGTAVLEDGALTKPAMGTLGDDGQAFGGTFVKPTGHDGDADVYFSAEDGSVEFVVEPGAGIDTYDGTSADPDSRTGQYTNPEGSGENAKLTLDPDGSVELEEGTVHIGGGASGAETELKVGDNTVAGTDATVTATPDGGADVTVPAGGTFTVTDKDGNEKEFTVPADAADGATFHVNPDGSVELEEGSVKLGEDDTVLFGDTDITGSDGPDGTPAVTVTVPAGAGESAGNAKVEVEPSGAVEVDGKTYTNGDDTADGKLELEVTPDGSVELKDGAVELPETGGVDVTAGSGSGASDYTVEGGDVTVEKDKETGEVTVTVPATEGEEKKSAVITEEDGTEHTYTSEGEEDLEVQLTPDGPAITGGAAGVPEGDDIIVPGTTDATDTDVRNTGDGDITVEATETGATVTVPEGGSAEFTGKDSAGSERKTTVEADDNDVEVQVDADTGALTVTPKGDEYPKKVTVDGKTYTLTEEPEDGTTPSITVEPDGTVTLDPDDGSWSVEVELPEPGEEKEIHIAENESVDIGDSTYTGGEGGADLRIDDKGNVTLESGSVVLPSQADGNGSKVDVEFGGKTVPVQNVQKAAPSEESQVTVTAPTSPTGKGKAQVHDGGAVKIGDQVYTVPEGADDTTFEFDAQGNVSVTEGSVELEDGQSVGFGKVKLGNDETDGNADADITVQVTEGTPKTAQVTVPEGETLTVTDAQGNRHTYKNNGEGDMTLTVDENGNVTLSGQLPTDGVELGGGDTITIGDSAYTAGDDGATLKKGEVSIPVLDSGSVNPEAGASVKVGDSTVTAVTDNAEIGVDEQGGATVGGTDGRDVEVGFTDPDGTVKDYLIPAGKTAEETDAGDGLKSPAQEKLTGTASEFGAEGTDGRPSVKLSDGSTGSAYFEQTEEGGTLTVTPGASVDVKDNSGKTTTFENPADAENNAHIELDEDGSATLTDGTVEMSGQDGEKGSVKVGRNEVEAESATVTAPGKTASGRTETGSADVTVPAGGSFTVKDKNGNEKEFTVPEDSTEGTTFHVSPDGSVELKDGSVELGDGNEIDVSAGAGGEEKDYSVKGDGVQVEKDKETGEVTVTVPAAEGEEKSSVTVSDGDKTHNYTNEGETGEDLKVELTPDGPVITEGAAGVPAGDDINVPGTPNNTNVKNTGSGEGSDLKVEAGEDGTTVTVPQGGSAEFTGKDPAGNERKTTVEADGDNDVKVQVGEDGTLTVTPEGDEYPQKVTVDGKTYTLTEEPEDGTTPSITVNPDGTVTLEPEEGAWSVEVEKPGRGEPDKEVHLNDGESVTVDGNTVKGGEGGADITVDSDGDVTLREGSVVLPHKTGEGAGNNVDVEFTDENGAVTGKVHVTNPDTGEDVTVTAPTADNPNAQAQVPAGGSVQIGSETYTVPEDGGDTTFEFDAQGNVSVTEGSVELEDGQSVGFGDVKLGNDETDGNAGADITVQVTDPDSTPRKAEVTVPEGETLTVTDKDGNKYTYKNNGEGDMTLTVDEDGNVTVEELPENGLELGRNTTVTVKDSDGSEDTLTAGGSGATLKPDGGDSYPPVLDSGSVKFPADSEGSVKTGTPAAEFTGKNVEVLADTGSGNPGVRGLPEDGGTVKVNDVDYYVPGGQTAPFENGKLGAPAVGKVEGNVGLDNAQYVVVPDKTEGKDQIFTDPNARTDDDESGFVLGDGSAFDVRAKGSGTVKNPSGPVTGHYEAADDNTRVVVDHTTGEVTLTDGSLNVSGSGSNTGKVTVGGNVIETRSANVTAPGIGADGTEEPGSADVTLRKGESFTLDGETYTAESDGTVFHVGRDGKVSLKEGSTKLGQDDSVYFGGKEITGSGAGSTKNVTVTAPAEEGSENAGIEVQSGGTVTVGDETYTNSGSGRDTLELEVTPEGDVELADGTVTLPDNGSEPDTSIKVQTEGWNSDGEQTSTEYEVAGDGVKVSKDSNAGGSGNDRVTVTVPEDGETTVTTTDENGEKKDNVYTNEGEEDLEIELTLDGPVLKDGKAGLGKDSQIGVETSDGTVIPVENTGDKKTTVEKKDDGTTVVDIPAGGKAKVNGVEVEGPARVTIGPDGSAQVESTDPKDPSVKVGGVTYYDDGTGAGPDITITEDGSVEAENARGVIERELPITDLYIPAGGTLEYDTPNGPVTLTGGENGATVDLDENGNVTGKKGDVTVKGPVSAAVGENAPEDTTVTQIGDVEIQVYDKDGNPVQGANVTVVVTGPDGEEYTGVTDKNGKVTIPDVPYGVYSVVVEKTVGGETVTSTGSVIVDEPLVSGEGNTFRMDVVIVNTVVESDLGGDTIGKPAVAGLNKVVTESDRNAGEDGSEVVIDITLSAHRLDGGNSSVTSRSEKAQIKEELRTEALRSAATDNLVEFVDVTVTKTVTVDGDVDSSETVPTTPELLTIAFAVTGSLKDALDRVENGTADNIFVVRRHTAADGSATTQTLRKVSERVGKTANFECYYIRELNGVKYIIIRAQNFSVYAFGVAEEQVRTEDPYTPSYDSYQVILPNSFENGTVTANRRYAYAGDLIVLTVRPNEFYELEQLTVTDRNGNAIRLTDNGDGTYSFFMPAGDVTVSVKFRHECPSRKFPDLNVAAWYHLYTDYVIKYGIMNGYDTGVFAPDGTVTRAEMVMTLWNLAERPQADLIIPFEDVEEGAWYAEAIRWAAAQGIVKGYTDTVFGPNDRITREQMMTILYRYRQSTGSVVADLTYRLPFTDAGSVSGWAYEAVVWCTANGIVNGRDADLVVPAGYATRAELAAVLTRFDRLSKAAKK